MTDRDPFSLLLPPPRSVRRLGGAAPSASLAAPPRIQRDASIPVEGFTLRIDRAGTAIRAADDAGERHACAAVAQLRRIAALPGFGSLPAAEIEDAPAIARRGVMLDVSRCRVPTMPEFASVVRTLEALRLNHAQLYTEHAFAYPAHEPVWRGSDPITPDEAEALDGLFGTHGVELAPNQNCFGHLARWLRTPGYEHLAETHGDWIFAGMPRSGPFSLCPTDPGSLRLVEGLLDAMLPCFRSGLVNVGCDETFDVGQGRSKAAVAAEGKAAVYGRFVRDVCRLVLDRGRVPMFWADVARDHPEALSLIPAEAVAMVWSYEPGHDWGREAALHAGDGGPPRRWWACPGTSSWRSFAGRPAERRANIREAARAAIDHGAEGLLATDWGDLGHRQDWPVALLGIAEAADAAWTGSDRGPGFLDAVSLHLFGDPSLRVAAWLERLGDADEPLRAVSGVPDASGRPTRLLNASALFTELHPPPLPLGLPDRPGPWLETRERLADATRDLPGGLDEHLAAELRHAARCSLFACDVAIARRGGPGAASPDALSRERDEIVREQATLWRRRSREGGLAESLAFWQQIDPMARGDA